jgi:hypothetical protein
VEHVKEKTSAGTVDEDRQVRRRSLLTRSGVVLAGMVGATAGGAALSGSADAATGDPVAQGTTNNVGTNVPATEIVASNSSTATPTVIVTNNGGSTATGEASPALRLTPAASGLVVPSASTAGGDMVATSDGELWFTHQYASTSTSTPPPPPVPAIVHTDANSNSFVPLSAPYRILDTRTSTGRAHVLDPSGKFDSAGRLLRGQTIHIDLTSLVYFGDAVTANLTVTGSTASGYLTVWPGGTRPTASAIDYATGQSIANMTVTGIAAYSSSVTDSIAIYASASTFVILDIAGFYVSNIAQVNPAYGKVSSSTSRAQQIKQAVVQSRW